MNIADTKPKKKGLTIHIGKMHGAEKVESFKCDICENESISESMLKVHQSKYHIWKCRYCNMSINKRGKHMREHHGFLDEEIRSEIEDIFIKNNFNNQDKTKNITHIPPLTLP